MVDHARAGDDEPQIGDHITWEQDCLSWEVQCHVKLCHNLMDKGILESVSAPQIHEEKLQFVDSLIEYCTHQSLLQIRWQLLVELVLLNCTGSGVSECSLRDS